MESALGDFLSVAGLVVAAQLLATMWLKLRLESSINAQYDKQLEDYRYELRTREQAAKAAEYLSLAWRLEANDNAEVYRRVNQLGWELALWLPDNIYRQMTLGIARPSDDRNILTTLVEIRKILLRHPGTLTADDIAVHAPNARESGQQQARRGTDKEFRTICGRTESI